MGQRFSLHSLQERAKSKVKMPTFVIRFFLFLSSGINMKRGAQAFRHPDPILYVHRVFKSIVTNSNDEGDDNKNNKW